MKVGNSVKSKQKTLARVNKTPNPTNFSNSKSQMYLIQMEPLSASNSVELPEFNETIDLTTEEEKSDSDIHKVEDFKSVKPFKNLTIEFPVIASASALVPLTTKPKACIAIFPENCSCSTSKDSTEKKIEFAARLDCGPAKLQKLEKLSPKLLSPANETCIDLPSDPTCNPSETNTKKITSNGKKQINHRKESAESGIPVEICAKATNQNVSKVNVKHKKTGSEINEDVVRKVIMIMRILSEIMAKEADVVSICQEWWELAAAGANPLLDVSPISVT